MRSRAHNLAVALGTLVLIAAGIALLQSARFPTKQELSQEIAETLDWPPALRHENAAFRDWPFRDPSAHIVVNGWRFRVRDWTEMSQPLPLPAPGYWYGGSERMFVQSHQTVTTTGIWFEVTAESLAAKLRLHTGNVPKRYDLRIFVRTE